MTGVTARRCYRIPKKNETDNKQKQKTTNNRPRTIDRDISPLQGFKQHADKNYFAITNNIEQFFEQPEEALSAPLQRQLGQAGGALEGGAGDGEGGGRGRGGGGEEGVQTPSAVDCLLWCAQVLDPVVKAWKTSPSLISAMVPMMLEIVSGLLLPSGTSTGIFPQFTSTSTVERGIILQKTITNHLKHEKVFCSLIVRNNVNMQILH